MGRAFAEEGRALSSADIAAVISTTDFSACVATVVGYGYMGKQYVKALRALGVRRIRVCSRSAGPLEELQRLDGVETVAGGIERLDYHPQPYELGIVAMPTLLLVAAAERLASLGVSRLLIEKPVSLWSSEIDQLSAMLRHKGVEAVCAYNRVAYPSFHETRSRAAREGGVTSCAYTFTEMIKPDWPDRFPAVELARWGVANSLHVMSMAHGLIGFPKTWNGHRSGALSWHTSGSIFVGSGISERGIPFSYHADWGSTGRWSIEVHTRLSSYRLCPLEKVYRRTSALGDWEEIPVATFAPDVKVGVVEEVAAMLSRDIRQVVPLFPLGEAARLTRYGEEVFGYPDRQHPVLER